MLAAVGAAVYWLQFAPVAVNKHLVTRGEIVAEVMGTGTLEARVKATISPKISGLITTVFVDQGDHVTKGQVLVQLDDTDFKRQVESSEANVAATTIALDRLGADKTRAVAILEFARSEHRRLERLKAISASANVELDVSVKNLSVAEADFAHAEAAIAEGKKQLTVAEQTLGYYRARLADTVIKAPCDGLVVRRDRDPGDVVVPGSSILAIVSTDEIWVSAWVDETEMARLKPGQTARVVFRSEPNRSYEGEVARLGREADRETREFVVDVRIRTLPENWAVGQRAEVYIETARKKDVTILPSRLIVWRDAKPGTFVEVGGRARWRPLTLGLRSREAVEVLTGFQPGDTVVRPADPQATPLTEGRRVKAS